MRRHEPPPWKDAGDDAPGWTVQDAWPETTKFADPDEHDGWQAIRPRRRPLPFAPER